MVVCPLDDNLPIIRLNRTGLEMLQAMNGHTTVGALAEKYGQKICGPDGQPGQWHLEHWALPTFSLCYYGTEPLVATVIKPNGIYSSSRFVKAGQGRMGSRGKNIWKTFIITN